MFLDQFIHISPFLKIFCIDFLVIFALIFVWYFWFGLALLLLVYVLLDVLLTAAFECAQSMLFVLFGVCFVDNYNLPFLGMRML